MDGQNSVEVKIGELKVHLSIVFMKIYINMRHIIYREVSY